MIVLGFVAAFAVGFLVGVWLHATSVEHTYPSDERYRR